MTGGAGENPAGERSEEEKERLKAERELRKAQKDAEVAAKRAKKEAEAKAKAAAEAAEAAAMREPILYLSQADEPQRKFGDYATVMSRSETGRTFESIRELGAVPEGKTVWVRARVAGVRGKGRCAERPPPPSSPIAASAADAPLLRFG
jgi:hypothetical protein